MLLKRSRCSGGSLTLPYNDFCSIRFRANLEKTIIYDIGRQPVENYRKHKKNAENLQERLCEHFYIGFEIGNHCYPFITIARRAWRTISSVVALGSTPFRAALISAGE